MENKIMAVITTSGICVKLFLGNAEVSINLEPKDGQLPSNFVGKEFGYKSDLCIYENPSQKTGEEIGKLTPQFTGTEDIFVYGPDAFDVAEAIAFAVSRHEKKPDQVFLTWENGQFVIHKGEERARAVAKENDGCIDVYELSKKNDGTYDCISSETFNHKKQAWEEC